MIPTRIVKLRSSSPWRLAAALTFCVFFALVLVLLALELLGLSTLPGLFLIALPGGLLWDSGYRGSLIDWGDGWAWLTPPGIVLVYGPILAVFSWFLYWLWRGGRRNQSK